MAAFDTKKDAGRVTSQLIDLIIKLPQQEQLVLLQRLSGHEARSSKSTAPRSIPGYPDYASGDYFYWDLFS